MIDMKFKPKWLPQVNAPFTYVLNSLKGDGVNFKLKKINPSKLKPSQGIVFGDKVSDIDPQSIKPLWISNDNYVLDGHHRYCAALANELPYIKVVRIDLNRQDAVRVLNKIMDIYEYQEQEKIEEIVAQDEINVMNDPDTNSINFLEMLETESREGEEEILHDNSVVGGKKKSVSGYRKQPIKENSLSGNFFSIKPIEGYKKYDIEFDNLLDTNDMGIQFYSDSNPIITLSKNWFPNINFNKLAKKYDVKPSSLINRAICEKARKMGYDGIKYGDIMIQGLN